MQATGDSSDVVADLEAARERVQRRRDAIDVDPAALDALVDAYRSVERVLERWEERATDWDDFQGYVEFRNDLAETLEETPDDVPEREAFVEAAEHVQASGMSKTLKSQDFEAARAALEPVRKRVERREALTEAREELRAAVRAAKERRRDLEDRIDDLERLRGLTDVDLDAPVEVLCDPIERYDDAVETAFATFREEASAREVLEFVATAAGYPLVALAEPPEDLLAYVREHPAGERTVDELLSFSEYSSSKLDHYVDDPALLKRRVATNRTYLEGLDADALTVGWPPAAAGTLRRRVDELVSLVGRFADEETVSALRAVRELTRREDYERLRAAARARSELDATERRLLREGAVREELEAAREERRRLRAVLEAVES